MRRSKNFLTLHGMKVLYYAQIHSNLAYCLSIWGNMITNTNVQKLRKLTDQCVSTIEIYVEHGILPFGEMILHEMCKLWHKFHLNMLPPPLMRNMQTDYKGDDLVKNHQYNTRNKCYLNQPYVGTPKYKKSFLSKGLRVYNELLLKIRSCNKIESFCALSKKHVLSRMSF